MNRYYTLAAVAAALAVIGAARLAVPQHHDLPPLHPELLAPKTVTVAASPESRVTVPNLHGLSLDEAIQALCRAGLETNPLVGRAPATPDLVERVVAQDPPADTIVERGTQVGFALGEKATPPAASSGARR